MTQCLLYLLSLDIILPIDTLFIEIHEGGGHLVGLHDKQERKVRHTDKDGDDETQACLLWGDEKDKSSEPQLAAQLEQLPKEVAARVLRVQEASGKKGLGSHGKIPSVRLRIRKRKGEARSVKQFTTYGRRDLQLPQLSFLPPTSPPFPADPRSEL